MFFCTKIGQILLKKQVSKGDTGLYLCYNYSNYAHKTDIDQYYERKALYNMKSNNFTQALKELTGFDGPADAAGEETPAQPKSAAKAPAESAFQPEEHTAEPFNLDDLIPEKTVDISGEEVTHITSTMVINGDIKSEDNILVEGQIYGNVQTAANLTSSNLIIGNLNAQNAALNDARLKGDINLDGHLNVNSGTVVIGDVACDSIKVSGKIKGNLDIKSSVVLKDRALISGNIIADDIAAEPGTRINGTISTRSDSFDLDAEFDFGGDF